MTRWEYLSIFFAWEEWREGREKKRDWVMVLPDGTRLVDMTTIMNHYGAEGWELVNLIPETAKGRITALASAEVKGFRGVFKRSLEDKDDERDQLSIANCQ